MENEKNVSKAGPFSGAKSLRERLAASCLSALAGLAAPAPVESAAHQQAAAAEPPFIASRPEAQQMNHRLVAVGRMIAGHFAERVVKVGMERTAQDLEALRPTYEEVREFNRRFPREKFPDVKLPEELELALAKHAEATARHEKMCESYRFFCDLAQTPLPEGEPAGEGALVMVTERIGFQAKTKEGAAQQQKPAVLVGTVTYPARIAPSLLWKIEKKGERAYFEELDKAWGRIGYLNPNGERRAFSHYLLRIIGVKDPLVSPLEASGDPAATDEPSTCQG